MVNTLELIKSLKGLNLKRTAQGFTLIELLIVVIILGILAAIALPNLLSQVSKGRQAEAKNNLGALNRVQQAYRLEELTFTNNVDDLPVKFSWKYYSLGFGITTRSLLKYYLPSYAQALPDYENDILDYGAGIVIDGYGNLNTVLCEEKYLNANSNDPPYFTELATQGSQTIVRCNSSFSKNVK